MTIKDDKPTQKPLTPRVEPGDSDDKERHEIFTQMAIKSVAELRKHLDPSSIDNRRIYPLYIPKARDYVISGMMNEVEKAAISSMFTSNFILESNAQVITDEQQKEQEKMKAEMPELEGNIFQSRIDEMVLWERKLTEQLVDIVGFRHVRKDDYYRHYTLLREMERLEKISSDFKHYHGAENKNIEHQLTDLRNEADELLAKLDPAKCWYVEAASSKKNDGAPKPSTRLINISIRKTILDFWSNIGGKEFAYGKKDEGFKKMGEYLEKQKAVRKQKK